MYAMSSLLHIHMVGTTVKVFSKEGRQYSGVCHTLGPLGGELGIVLDNARLAGQPGEFFPRLVLKSEDVMEISATDVDLWGGLEIPTVGSPEVPLPEASSRQHYGFKTDAAISGQNGTIRERPLQKWVADDAAGVNLDEETFGSSRTQNPPKGQKWDQFATNEKLFGLTTNFNEEEYTTKLDRSAPNFKERERRASRIANEIISSHSSNPHVREERNQSVPGSEPDEEDRYSGVRRDQSNAESSRPHVRRQQRMSISHMLSTGRASENKPHKASMATVDKVEGELQQHARRERETTRQILVKQQQQPTASDEPSASSSGKILLPNINQLKEFSVQCDLKTVPVPEDLKPIMFGKVGAEKQASGVNYPSFPYNPTFPKRYCQRQEGGMPWLFSTYDKLESDDEDGQPAALEYADRAGVLEKVNSCLERYETYIFARVAAKDEASTVMESAPVPSSSETIASQPDPEGFSPAAKELTSETPAPKDSEASSSSVAKELTSETPAPKDPEAFSTPAEKSKENTKSGSKWKGKGKAHVLNPTAAEFKPAARTVHKKEPAAEFFGQKPVEKGTNDKSPDIKAHGAQAAESKPAARVNEKKSAAEFFGEEPVQKGTYDKFPEFKAYGAAQAAESASENSASTRGSSGPLQDESGSRTIQNSYTVNHRDAQGPYWRYNQNSDRGYVHVTAGSNHGDAHGPFWRQNQNSDRGYVATSINPGDDRAAQGPFWRQNQNPDRGYHVAAGSNHGDGPYWGQNQGYHVAAGSNHGDAYRAQAAESASSNSASTHESGGPAGGGSRNGRNSFKPNYGEAQGPYWRHDQSSNQGYLHVTPGSNHGNGQGPFWRQNLNPNHRYVHVPAGSNHGNGQGPYWRPNQNFDQGYLPMAMGSGHEGSSGACNHHVGYPPPPPHHNYYNYV